jgi:general secretion pathway protein L
VSETLVIRLAADDPGPEGTVRAEWAVLDDSGACVLAPATGPLDDAAPLAAARRTVVLVPSVRVLRTRADVPVKGAARVAQALPFALEDVLADDVEDLHFAAGARLADDQVAVAVVRRDCMDNWLARLAAAGIRPQAVCAEADAVPDIAGNSTLLVEDHQALLRDPGSDPVVGEPGSLDGLLELWLAQPRPAGDDGAAPPRHLQVYDATVDGLANGLWERFQDRVASIEVRRLPDGALLRLAAGIVTSPGVNLLQGAYATRNTLGSHWQRWRLAATLVAALAATVVATAGADAWRLRRESAALEAAIREAAAFTFPGVDPATDLRALVSARLEGAAGAASGTRGRRFLDTMQTIAVAVAKTGNARIEGLNYRAGVLELQVRAPNAESLDSIRKFVVEAGGLKADIQSSNAVGDEIQGSIRVSGAGA